MSEPNQRTIVAGISVDASGQATVDAALGDVLFDIALVLEERTDLPVDMQHVLAAVVLAARDGELNADTQLLPDDSALMNILDRHVKTVFSNYGGNVGADD